MKLGLWRTALLAGVLLLQGCITTYAPKPNEKMSAVKVVGLGWTKFCVDGTTYFPVDSTEDADSVLVPAGKRITLISHIRQDDYTIVFNCYPQLSFEPVHGQLYYMNGAFNGSNRCVIELARADSQSETGLAMESTLAKGHCGP